MKQKTKKGWSILMTAVMIGGMLAGCQNSSNTGAATKPTDSASNLAPMELRFMMRGPEPNQLREVLNEVEKRAKDKLNVKITMDWVPIPDQKTKIQLALAAQEDYAAIFDGPFINYQDGVSKKLYAQLDSYFMSDKYPGLKKEFTKEIVDNMKDAGHNYAVPLLRGFSSPRYYLIRKDLRVKYGMPELKSIGDLEKYFDNVLKNEKGILPYAASAINVINPVTLDRSYYLENKNCTTMFTFVQNLSTPICVSPDGKKVAGMYFPGDPVESYKDFPESLKSHLLDPQKKSAEWYSKGYVSKDVITIKDPLPDFYAGKYAAVETDNANLPTLLDKFKTSTPGAELEIVMTNEKKDLKPGTSETDYRANNFIVIPAYSKKIDRTMMFFDWLFSSPENHDLVELGIEGKNWEKSGDKRYKTPQGVDLASNYNFPPYRLTWSTNLSKAKDGMPDIYYKIDDYTLDLKSNYLSPIKGFTFNTEPVKSEWAKVIPVYQDEAKPIMLGMVPDVDEAYKKINAKARQLGLEKIRAEIIKQLEEYLASR